MASSSSSILRDLDPPDLKNDDRDWDMTYETNKTTATLDQHGICSHAVAHGTRVFASKLSSWHTDLAPHQVHSVTSNNDGSVIVAATDGGTVSLIRGTDGKVLATRTVGDSATVVSLSWVGGGSQDCLLVEAPTEQGNSNLILVSNIDGPQLNQEGEAAALAARQMQVQTLTVEQDVRAMVGYYLTPEKIRFVACGSEGQLIVLDFSLQSGVFVTVGDEVKLGSDKEWMVHYELGFRTQVSESGKTYFVCGASSGDATALFWFDPGSLRPACRFVIPKTADSNKKRSKLLACEPVCPVRREDSLAVALAEKSSSSSTTEASVARIYVVQAIVEETLGLEIISKPHVVYTIPIEEPATLSVTLASLTDQDRPYYFRYKLWRSADDCIYKEFVPNDTTSQPMGLFRLELARDKFDAADAILADDSTTQSMIADPFANFYPSEVALKRLQSWLRHGDTSAAEQANQYMRQLAAGAVSGNRKALAVLYEATRSVVHLSSNRRLSDMIVGLSAFSACLQEVRDALAADDTPRLTSQHQKLEKQLSALKALQQLDVTLETTIQNIRSPAHLFAVLIQENKFAKGERFCRLGIQLSSEELVSPVLAIRSSVPPHQYIPLLRDLVLPRLVAHDDLLVHLRAWACRMADALDDKAKLDDAILLLQVRADEVKRSNLVHVVYSRS